VYVGRHASPFVVTAQHSTAQHSTTQYSTAQYSTAQHSTAQHSTVQHSTAQYSTAHYSTAQYSTVQYSTAQYSTVQHSKYSTVQHSTAQHSTAQPNSNTSSPIESEALVREFNVGVFFKHNADLDYDENNFETGSEARYTLYTGEEKLERCARITIKIGEEDVSTILDTGCELTV